MYIAPPKGAKELALYKKWVEAHGFIPIVLKHKATIIDGPLLLCGGADIGVNPVRDRYEFAWIRSALENGQPIIGICRGMQILNYYFGGKVEDIEGIYESAHQIDKFRDDGNHHERLSQYHKIEDIDGNTMIVNSRHHQYCSKIADLFMVTHRTVGGGNIVEGFENVAKQIWAVQWHPERMEAIDNTYPLNKIMKQK